MARIDGRLPNHHVTIPERWVNPDPDRVIVKPVTQTHELDDPTGTEEQLRDLLGLGRDLTERWEPIDGAEFRTL